MPNPIVIFEQQTYDLDGWPYRVEANCIPPDEADARIRDRFDSRAIDLPKELGSIWFEVFDPVGAWAATATFACGEGVVRCDLIEVERPHRRQGIATVVYILASKIFDAPVVPASVRSDDALAFWAGRTEIRG
ncbi:hypothetical protein [Brevundimonas vancanneytii]|uniref:N-acetyltransferase domain-containing protein n=1 Tax=Brevundimonas vancanneytii TaxID=1325724 RepID=A0A4P1KBN3_9CAUL|nr:hypothetical protein [Brevundimonas vancanneytii]VTO17790.1 Uncharacterised protein [Brevundimonas vancanneytii]